MVVRCELTCDFHSALTPTAVDSQSGKEFQSCIEFDCPRLLLASSCPASRARWCLQKRIPDQLLFSQCGKPVEPSFDVLWWLYYFVIRGVDRSSSGIGERQAPLATKTGSKKPLRIRKPAPSLQLRSSFYCALNIHWFSPDFGTCLINEPFLITPETKQPQAQSSVMDKRNPGSDSMVLQIFIPVKVTLDQKRKEEPLTWRGQKEHDTTQSCQNCG